jgi:hypothetical protein
VCGEKRCGKRKDFRFDPEVFCCGLFHLGDVVAVDVVEGAVAGKHFGLGRRGGRIAFVVFAFVDQPPEDAGDGDPFAVFHPEALVVFAVVVEVVMVGPGEGGGGGEAEAGGQAEEPDQQADDDFFHPNHSLFVCWFQDIQEAGKLRQEFSGKK